MRLKWLAYGAGAIALHLVVLFILRLEQPATLLPPESQSVEVSIVAAEAPPVETPPAPQPVSELTKTLPEPTPEPRATPLPEETPPPMPETTPPPKPEPAETAHPTPRPMSSPRPSKSNSPRPAKADASPQKSATTTSQKSPSTGKPSAGATLAIPRYRSNPPPEYPEEARIQGQQGVALIAVKVNAEGNALRVSLRSSTGFPALDQAALRSVRNWRFEPARLAGVPVTSEVVVPVRFHLND